MYCNTNIIVSLTCRGNKVHAKVRWPVQERLFEARQQQPADQTEDPGQRINIAKIDTTRVGLETSYCKHIEPGLVSGPPQVSHEPVPACHDGSEEDSVADSGSESDSDFLELFRQKN